MSNSNSLKTKPEQLKPKIRSKNPKRAKSCENKKESTVTASIVGRLESMRLKDRKGGDDSGRAASQTLKLYKEPEHIEPKIKAPEPAYARPCTNNIKPQ